MRMEWSRISRQWQSAAKMSPAVQRVWTRTRTGWGQGGRKSRASRAGRRSPRGRRAAAGAQVAADQGDVAFAAVDLGLVGDHAEFAIAGVDAGFAGADDVALVAEAVADEFGDGEDAQAVLAAERDEVGDARHLAVVAHDFADHAGGSEAGHAGEVDGGLGLAGADEDAAAAGAEGKDVAGAGEVGGGGFGIDGDADGVGAIGGGDAGGDAFARLDGLSEGGAEAGGVLLRHGEEAQVVGALLGEGEADEAAAIAGHEVDGFGSDVLGGEGEVAFVLAIFVVDDDDHAAGANFVEGAGDVGERGLGRAGLQACGCIYCRRRCGEWAKDGDLVVGRRHPRRQNRERRPLRQKKAQGRGTGFWRHKQQKRRPKAALLQSGRKKAYNVDSISKPHASSRASGMYLEFLLRRAHSRRRVDRMYWSGVSLNSLTICSKEVTVGTTGPMGSGLPQFGFPRRFAIFCPSEGVNLLQTALGSALGGSL